MSMFSREPRDTPLAQDITQEASITTDEDSNVTTGTAALESDTSVEITEDTQTVEDATALESSAETLVAELTEAANDSGNQEVIAQESVEQSTESDAEVGQLQRSSRRTSGATSAVLTHLDQMRKYDRRVAHLHQGVHDLQMITSFTQVAQDHNLSAPLVSAFRATPGFDQAVANFPNSSLYDIVPEHTNSASNTQGLESFVVATDQATDDIRNKARELVATYQDILSGLATTVDSLKAQVRENKADLEASDVTDEVLVTLPVTTISHEAFTELLTKLEEQLRAIDTFNVDDLRAHPETIKDTVTALSALVGDLGRVIGLSVNEYGLSEADKDASFEPSPGDFGSKSITKSGLIFYLDKADTILDALKAITDRKDELASSTTDAVTDIPTILYSDDVNYGCTEHVILLSSYTTLITKLIRESIMVVSMLLSTVDSVFDLDDGVLAD